MDKIPTTMELYSVIPLPRPIQVNTKLLENLGKQHMLDKLSMFVNQDFVNS